ncbi:ANK3-like protein, partial [Mya arenaria]
FQCAKKGDVEGIKKVLNSNNEDDAETDAESDSDKVDVNFQDQNGLTALHYAAREYHHAAVQLLLENKAELDDIDGNKRTPLHIAAIKGNVEAAKLLLTSKKNGVDCEDGDGNTPLMLASKYGNEELIDFLIDKYKCNINYQNEDGMTALHYAALYGKENAVKKLLQHDAINLNNTLKKSAFHLACENNNIKCAKKLRLGKCAKDTPDENGFTPFMHAVAKGFAEIVQDLMNSGDIDPCVKLADGRNVLHIVAERNKLAVLKILLDKQSNDLAVKREKTGLMSSINEIQNIIENMVTKNRDLLYEKDEKGDTVYHLAAREGHDRLLDVLLREDKENKISKSPESENNDGCTPLWVAADSGHLKCVEHLSTRTVLIEKVNKSKLTPLMVASQKGHADVVEYLINKNANVSALDENDHNCLEIAIRKHHESVAMTIIKSDQWEKALRNYTNDDDGMECTPLRKLIRHMPDCAKAVLDNCMCSSAEKKKTSMEKKQIKQRYHLTNMTRKKNVQNTWLDSTSSLLTIYISSKNGKIKKVSESGSEAGQLNLLVHPVTPFSTAPNAILRTSVMMIGELDFNDYENQVEINQNKMIHKQKNLKKAMKTMKTEIDKQGVILEEIKRKLFEETSTG